MTDPILFAASALFTQDYLSEAIRNTAEYAPSDVAETRVGRAAILAGIPHATYVADLRDRHGRNGVWNASRAFSADFGEKYFLKPNAPALFAHFGLIAKANCPVTFRQPSYSGTTGARPCVCQ